MPSTTVNGTRIEFEELGDRRHPPLVLVAGLGAQMVSWDDDFVARLVALGLRVIRFDNRDVGLSSMVDDDRDPVALVMAHLGGQEIEAPYGLADMAADTIGLLDSLDVAEANVLGMSMGGMIAQQVAIAHPDRIRTLTSVMSTTGDPDVGMPQPAVLAPIMAPTPADPAAAVDHKMRIAETIGSPGLFDPARARRRAEIEVARSWRPHGTVRQMLAILTSPSRSDALRSLQLPALVIHGDADPLVDPSGGQRTHECLADSRLVMIDGMGHDLPAAHWDTVVGELGSLVGAGDPAVA